VISKSAKDEYCVGVAQPIDFRVAHARTCSPAIMAAISSRHVDTTTRRMLL
jgi:hypothetical protein